MAFVHRDLGAYELVQACETLGAGEILLNCMDKDGTNSGYDLGRSGLIRGYQGLSDKGV
jgi:imidazole glycerol phosphate synthase subunit HisF